MDLSGWFGRVDRQLFLRESLFIRQHSRDGCISRRQQRQTQDQ